MEFITNRYSGAYNRGKEFMTADEEYLLVRNWHYKPYKGTHSTYDWQIMKRTSPTSWQSLNVNRDFTKAYDKIPALTFKNIRTAKKYVLSLYKEK